MLRFFTFTLVVILCVSVVKSDLSRKTRANSNARHQGCIRSRVIDYADIPESSPITYFQLSPQNTRTEYAEACIGPEHLKTGSPTNRASRQYKLFLGGTKCHHAGHVIGNQLGGNVDQRNLFPQLSNINCGAWRMVENNVAEVVRQENGNVWFQVNLQYHTDTDTIPYEITYKITRLPNNDTLSGDWVVIREGSLPNENSA